jgi:hypothetical protein
MDEVLRKASEKLTLETIVEQSGVKSFLQHWAISPKGWYSPNFALIWLILEVFK